MRARRVAVTHPQVQRAVGPYARRFFIIGSVFAIRTYVSKTFERLHERLMTQEVDRILDKPIFRTHVRQIAKGGFDQSVRFTNLANPHGFGVTVLRTRRARPNDVEITGWVHALGVKRPRIHSVRTIPFRIVVHRNDINPFCPKLGSQSLFNRSCARKQYQCSHDVYCHTFNRCNENKKNEHVTVL